MRLRLGTEVGLRTRFAAEEWPRDALLGWQNPPRSQMENSPTLWKEHESRISQPDTRNGVWALPTMKTPCPSETPPGYSEGWVGGRRDPRSNAVAVVDPLSPPRCHTRTHSLALPRSGVYPEGHPPTQPPLSFSQSHRRRERSLPLLRGERRVDDTLTMASRSTLAHIVAPTTKISGGHTLPFRDHHRRRHAHGNVIAMTSRHCSSPVPPPSTSSPCSSTIRVNLRALDVLSEGAHVAVIVLSGSLNPITRAHVSLLEQGRKILLDPDQSKAHFDVVIAVVSLDDDRGVRRKLPREADRCWLLKKPVRTKLVNDVTVGLPWVTTTDDTGMPINMTRLRLSYPQLTITDYIIAGADDVIASRRWEWLETGRLICVGRPGHTAAAGAAVVRHVAANPQLFYDVHQRGAFLACPELQGVPTGHARELAQVGTRQALLTVVHPVVADAMLAIVAAEQAKTVAETAVVATRPSRHAPRPHAHTRS